MPRRQSSSSFSSKSPLISLTDLFQLSVVLSKYKKHFTASAVVIEQSHILLVHHRRIGAWLSPGGHIEENELPHLAAIRETKEETGIDIVAIDNNLPAIKSETAFFLPAPLCMHAVKAVEKNETFYHIDLAYLCRVTRQNVDSTVGVDYIDSRAAAIRPYDSRSPDPHSLPKITSSPENHEARWIELDRLSELPLAANVPEIVALARSKLSCHKNNKEIK